MISTVAGNGLYQFSGDGGLSLNSQFSPQGIAVQSPGNFYIFDAQNYRIRKSSGGLITTAAGTGSCCYNGENLAANSAFLNASGVAVDSVGKFIRRRTPAFVKYQAERLRPLPETGWQNIQAITVQLLAHNWRGTKSSCVSEAHYMSRPSRNVLLRAT